MRRRKGEREGRDDEIERTRRRGNEMEEGRGRDKSVTKKGKAVHRCAPRNNVL